MAQIPLETTAHAASTYLAKADAAGAYVALTGDQDVLGIKKFGKYVEVTDPTTPELHFGNESKVIDGTHRAWWAMGMDQAAAVPLRDFFMAKGYTFSVTDGVLNSTTTITSATAVFLAGRSEGYTVTGTGIPAGTTIAAVVSPTQATLSAAATATATGVRLTFSKAGASVNDLFYWSHNGFDAASLGIGKPQPDATFRCQVQSEVLNLTQGALRVIANPGQTGDMLSVDSTAVTSAFRVAADGKTRFTASGATRTVADGVLNSTTTITSATLAFTSSDVGRFIVGTGIPLGAYISAVTDATTATLSAAATATASGVSLTLYVPALALRTVGLVPQLQVHPGTGTPVAVMVGNLSVGPGAQAVPGSTGEFRATGSNDCTLAVKTVTQGGFRVVASGTTAKVQVHTSNASELALGTNTTDRIRISSAGALHFAGGTPVALPTGTPAAATDLASAISLVNALRADLVAFGLIS